MVLGWQVQGKTLDYFIICLAPRAKGVRPALTLTDLYTLATRVKLGQNLYVLGIDNPSDRKQTEHLRKLRHNPVLAIWEASYDRNGFWSDAQARDAADRLVLEQQGGARTTGKRKAAPEPQPDSDADSDAD